MAALELENPPLPANPPPLGVEEMDADAGFAAGIRGPARDGVQDALPSQRAVDHLVHLGLRQQSHLHETWGLVYAVRSVTISLENARGT